MAEVVGVRFKRAGRVYYFDPSEIELEVNDCVVVKTVRGMEMGQVVIAPKQVLANEIEGQLKPVIRKAEPEDIERVRELEAKEEEALIECGKLIDKLDLSMKLLAAEHNLDGDRLTFFFSAESRVDFRELVRQLSSRFKVKVELRQVGPRDETKLIGGFGRCGRPLCCMNFLTEFAPVSIRMAKDQNLPLNPMKISGTCGRLLCCLTYENEQYKCIKARMPRIGQQVNIPSGLANVVGTNPLKETVMVQVEGEAVVELPLSEVKGVEDTSYRRSASKGGRKGTRGGN